MRKTAVCTSLSMKPTSWFQIGWSSAVSPGDVVPLRYFGQDLVAWRDERGTVRVRPSTSQHDA